MSAAKLVSDKQFSESRHRYRDPRSGERVISVTSIVGAFDASGDKLGAGAGAAVKLTREGKNYRQVWGDKAKLGTRVHSYASLWIAGQSADVLETDEGHADAFSLFCDEHSPEWLETERAVVSSLGYGGKFDAVVSMDDRWALVDFKTGRPWTVELALQLAGYRYADGMIVYDAEGQAVDVEPMPHIDACAGLYLHEDGTYDLVWSDVDETTFEMFKHLLALKQWASTVGKDQ
jgi:hypothetical protein